MANATLSDVAFPVLCLSHDNSIGVASNAGNLQSCNAAAFFKNRYFQDLVIIDSTFAQFRVAGAEPVPPLSGWRQGAARVFNRRLTVRLRLERARQPSVAEAKKQILIWLDRVPAFWEATYDMAEWKRKVEGARNMGALVALFS